MFKKEEQQHKKYMSFFSLMLGNWIETEERKASLFFIFLYKLSMFMSQSWLGARKS